MRTYARGSEAEDEWKSGYAGPRLLVPSMLLLRGADTLTLLSSYIQRLRLITACAVTVRGFVLGVKEA